MPYVLRDNIYGYIAQVSNFATGDNPEFAVVLYKDSLNNQLNLKRYDLVTIDVYDKIKRKQLTFSSNSTYQELPLVLGNSSEGEEGYVKFTIPSDRTSLFEAGDVFVKVTITQSSYVSTPIITELPLLKIAQKTIMGTESPITAKVFELV